MNEFITVKNIRCITFWNDDLKVNRPFCSLLKWVGRPNHRVSISQLWPAGPSVGISALNNNFWWTNFLNNFTVGGFSGVTSITASAYLEQMYTSLLIFWRITFLGLERLMKQIPLQMPGINLTSTWSTQFYHCYNTSTIKPMRALDLPFFLYGTETKDVFRGGAYGRSVGDGKSSPTVNNIPRKWHSYYTELNLCWTN